MRAGKAVGLPRKSSCYLVFWAIVTAATIGSTNPRCMLD
jgi:hypothetical protein